MMKFKCSLNGKVHTLYACYPCTQRQGKMFVCIMHHAYVAYSFMCVFVGTHITVPLKHCTLLKFSLPELTDVGLYL